MDEGRELPREGFEKGFPAGPEGASQRMEVKSYILAWLGIILLTGITFTLSLVKVGGWEVFLALLIAGTQAALALYYFMHLRDERARIFRILIPLVLVILLVFLALTFSDVAFRR